MNRSYFCGTDKAAENALSCLVRSLLAPSPRGWFGFFFLIAKREVNTSASTAAAVSRINSRYAALVSDNFSVESNQFEFRHYVFGHNFFPHFPELSLLSKRYGNRVMPRNTLSFKVRSAYYSPEARRAVISKGVTDSSYCLGVRC